MMLRDLFTDDNGNYIDLPNGCKIRPVIVQNSKGVLDALEIHNTIMEFTKEMSIDELTAIYILGQHFCKNQPKDSLDGLPEAYTTGVLQGILLGRFIKNTDSEIKLESVKLTTAELMSFMQSMPGRPPSEEQQ